MRRALLLHFFILLFLVATASFPYAQPIELPKGFPPLKEDIDPNSVPVIVPTNPYLSQKANFQPIGLSLQSELLSPEYLSRADSIDFGAYRLVINDADFQDLNSPNYIKLSSIIDKLYSRNRDILITLDSTFLDPEVYAGTFLQIVKTVGKKVAYFQLLDTINNRPGVSLRAYHETLSLVNSIRSQEGMDFKLVLGGISGIDRSLLDELSNLYILNRVDVIAFNLRLDRNNMELSRDSSATLAPHSLFETVATFNRLSSLGKEFFVTRLSASSCFPPPGVSQLDQASMLTRACLYLLNGGASRVFIDSLADTDPTQLSYNGCIGIIQADGSLKPAYYAIKNLASILRGKFFISPYYLVQMSNDFPAHLDPLFVHHLYSPSDSSIYLFYWTPIMNVYDRYTNLAIFRKDLTPVSMINLLGGESADIPYRRGANLLVFAHLPLSHIPTAIKLKMEKRGG